MLGRQQVRGIPTALSELMKNAHDAYASEVRIDYLRYMDLIVVRDDGMGMTPRDFEDRWLTLGTESKLAPVPAPPGATPRAQLGEKGIGRLAISVVGSQALVVTRAAASNRLFAALINWRVFEEPGLNLDEIEIATQQIDDMARIREQLGTLRMSAVQQIRGLRLASDRIARLVGELEGFPLDAVAIALRLPGPKIDISATGTQFFVSPVDTTLADNLIQSYGEASELVQDLAGFANPLDREPVMNATFWDWAGPGQPVELIGPEEFWTAQDLADADHEVNGAFDENGIFRGRVRVYDKWSESTIVPRTGAPVSKTQCGPFAVRFGYVQGFQRESRLDPNRWSELIQRLEQIAGLYVYRDGIRILPYGRHNFDWLDIERNRTKSASYYFFSYRRIFGYVAITRARNSPLSEKAGREGFRENAPYREFQSLLKGLFVQLAADFFREGGGEAGYFHTRRDELNREERARREHKRQTDEARRAFVRTLASQQKDLSAFDSSTVIRSILDDAAHELGQTRSPDQTSRVVREMTIRLEAVRRRFDLDLPPGVGLPDEVLRDWEAYKADRGTLIDALNETQGRVVDFAEGVLAVGSESAPPHVVGALLLAQVRASGEERTILAAAAARKEIAEALQRVEEYRENLLSDLERAADGSGPQLGEVDRLETLRALADRNERLLRTLESAARSIALTSSDGELLGPTEVLAAGDQELLRLRDQVERDLELAQLGLAVEVVGHEFRATIRGIRRHLRELGAWAKKNRGTLLRIHTDLVSAFEHLDSYLRLFTPLQRRMRASATTLSGAEINKFLSDLFTDRLQKHKVRLDVSDGFRRHKFEGSPAIFYPVFVNLVDNAIFWLADRPQPRVVSLDVEGETLIVQDTGPGVAAKDRPFVFEAGFTRKPGGRGLGLFISREVLKRNSFELSVGAAARGARFEIRPRPGAG